MALIQMPHYELFKKNGKTWGRLLAGYSYDTPITGYAVTLNTPTYGCRLTPDGRLYIKAVSEWDFGSGPSVQTPPMVYASLAHDMFCHLTNRRLIPFSERKAADLYFWTCLGEAGATVSRLWRLPAVFGYSQLVARWKDKQVRA
jgi:hypothetical protein